MKRNLILIALFAFIITACNTHKDKDTFDSAELKYNAKNYAEAYKEYKEVIAEYSSSEYAAKSLLKVGTMYQMFLIPNVSAEESNKKAVECYRQLFKDFPNSSDAPKAVFMSGFLLNNDLKKFEEAKIAYETFLKKFPNHELAPQVKIELENIGKSPEEILQNKIVKK